VSDCVSFVCLETLPVGESGAISSESASFLSLQPLTCLALNSLRALAAGRDELGAGLLEFLLDELGHRDGAHVALGG
jgi:hypothetical protein